MSELLSFILAQEDFRETRLQSLYSDLVSLQTTNSAGYTANTTAWKLVLSKACSKALITSSAGGGSSPDTLILPVTPSLLTSLSIPGFGAPTGLGCVINDGLASGEFIPLKGFLGREESIYYKPWVDPWKVIGWGLRQVGIGGGGAASDKLVGGDVVVVRNVEDVAKQVLRAVSRRSRDIDRVMTLETFEHELGGMLGKEDHKLSERDIKVLVKHLTRDLGEAKVEGKTIKFKTPDSPLTPITKSDITTAQLKHLILTQNLKVDALSSKISKLQNKAKTAAASNNKITALSALRSKKMTEEHLQTATNSLTQLENVLMKIEQAVDNATLIETLEQSSKVLEKLNKETGGVERVETVMDELADQMMETDEISRVVGETGAIKMDEVDDEVQAEFAELMRAEEEKSRKIAGEEREKREAEEAAKLAKMLAELTVADKPPVASEGVDVVERGKGVEAEAIQEVKNMKEEDKKRDGEQEALPA
ncbi:hypothetical protein ABW19_dt0210347 [Dactylella cylindrospora]|nr:hypothetical protein ABW19_dt0210347 [Dactylella cylindrospora]